MLNDLHASEYGRGGQNQRGVDILLYRDGNPDQLIGIQCRRYKDPLKKAKIRTDCDAAIAHFSDMKEIIFACTADDDTHATDDAAAVEADLRAAGRDIRVVLYGWQHLCCRIVEYQEAIEAFFPTLVPAAPLTVDASAFFQAGFTTIPEDLVTRFADAVATAIQRQNLPPAPPAPPAPAAAASQGGEDPALHARIDIYRDLFKDDKRPVEAESGLRRLLDQGDIDCAPHAKFRILTNLGSIALHLGREADAIALYETAYAARPQEAQAIANLAFARIVQDRPAEGMTLARQALDATPPADHAISYLLQAAARSDWPGDAEPLIPDRLRGCLHADLGLAEFHRRREVAGWQCLTIALADRHPHADEFIQIRGTALLSLAIDTGYAHGGGIGPVNAIEIARAAEDMKRFTEAMLDSGYAYEHDRCAHLNNTAVLLRLAGREADAVTLLRRGGASVIQDPTLHRLLALALVDTGRVEEAIRELEADTASENVLFRAELIGFTDAAKALELARQVKPESLPQGMAANLWYLLGNQAINANRPDLVDETVAALAASFPGSVVAQALALRAERLRGLAEEAFRERFRELARSVGDDLPLPERVLLAIELRDAGCPDDASRLLDGRIGLGRVSPTALLYIQCLVEARRDDAFRAALAQASDALRNHRTVLWFTAGHAWNAGDLPGAEAAISALIAQRPDNARARLLRLEIWVRADRLDAVRSEMEEPLEDLAWPRLEDCFQLARMLSHFGFRERAARYAYRLFLMNQTNPSAWMTLSAMVIGQRPGADSRFLEVANVGPDVAVDVAFDDGEKVLFIVETDAALRNLDRQSWELDQPLVRACWGLTSGARFNGPGGRDGVITALRHKLVARFHDVAANFNTRFPDETRFRRFSFVPGDPAAIEPILEQLRQRQELVRAEQQNYLAGLWPIGLLAACIGRDTIDVAQGISAQGLKLKVALGHEAERQAMVRAVACNKASGCVLDLLAFWNVWHLKVLDVIIAVCGPVHVCQRVLDRLMERREDLRLSAEDGAKSAQYQDGKIALTEYGPEVVQAWLGDLDASIAWLREHAVIEPVVISDAIPDVIKEHVSLGFGDLFDSLVIAWQKDLLLLSDDLPIRQVAAELGFRKTCWTHGVLLTARDRRRLDDERYVRATANLIGAGHDYVGIGGDDLVLALWLDFQVVGAPGPLFSALSSVIGGRNADPVSHVSQVIRFLFRTWADWQTWRAWSTWTWWQRWDNSAAERCRKQATSILLRCLIRERVGDYPAMLGDIYRYVGGTHPRGRSLEFRVFFTRWVSGHFLFPTTDALSRQKDAQADASAENADETAVGDGETDKGQRHCPEPTPHCPKRNRRRSR
jgi:tetratricopeptide (TPR) repeat protein